MIMKFDYYITKKRIFKKIYKKEIKNQKKNKYLLKKKILN